MTPPSANERRELTSRDLCRPTGCQDMRLLVRPLRTARDIRGSGDGGGGRRSILLLVSPLPSPLLLPTTINPSPNRMQHPLLPPLHTTHPRPSPLSLLETFKVFTSQKACA